MARVVYGKKIRRQAEDPFAAFVQSSSPEQAASIRNSLNSNPTDSITSSLAKCSLNDDRRNGTQKNRREVLKETDSNPRRFVPKKLARSSTEAVLRKDSESDVTEQTQAVIDVLEKTHIFGCYNEKIDSSTPIPSSQSELRRSPRRKPQTETPSTLLRRAISAIDDSQSPNAYDIHCAPLLDLSPHHISDFADWSHQLAEHFEITKIAEASFGEVYRLSLLHEFDDLSSADESVFKVIALRPPPSTLPEDKRRRGAALKKGEAMSKIEDVANEVRLLQRMSSIPGFTNFRDLRIMQGRPPPAFIAAFKKFNVTQRAKGKDASIFPDPARKTSYNADQLWAVVEMQDAGTDLEHILEDGLCSSIWSVWDIFWQVVLSLAKGEEGAEFEHRDLHLGNICVHTPQPLEDSMLCPIDTSKTLNFTALDTTIIDYTISRCKMPQESELEAQDIAYHDLSTAAEQYLFEADSTEEYQYEMYRYMRGVALLDHALAEFCSPTRPKPKSRNNASTKVSTKSPTATWRDFHPITNLVWLHFILYKLLDHLDRPSQMSDEEAEQMGEAELTLALELEERLCSVRDLLDPSVLSKDHAIVSASTLVHLAVAEEWLCLDDVVGHDEGDSLQGLSIDQGLEEELMESLGRMKLHGQSAGSQAGAGVEADCGERKSLRKMKRTR